MKRIFTLGLVVLFLCLSNTVMAERVVSPMYEIDLSISTGTTTALNQAGTYTGISWFNVNSTDSVIDLSKYGVNLQKFSVQAYQINLAKSNQNTIALSTVNASGATYTLYYTVSNKDDAGLWAGAGVTIIGANIALTGQTTVIQPFTPEFARYMRVGVLTGMTQFQNFRVVMEIQ